MTITTRVELIEALARIGLMGLAREGDLDSLFESGGATTITVADITDSTATGKALMKAVDAAAARTAIGAGTSSLVVGTSATQAKAGNYVPTSAEVSTALKAKAQITALSAVATPDATDQATANTLANALKVTLNATIAALKA